jgi:hypothetical protein
VRVVTASTDADPENAEDAELMATTLRPAGNKPDCRCARRSPVVAVYQALSCQYVA